MDVDIVLNEVCEDDDAVTVEFSQGPEAFKARCEALRVSNEQRCHGVRSTANARGAEGVLGGRLARRWEGRPNTPPFQWGKEGEIGPTDNEWLNEMDLKSLGLDALVNPDLVAQNRAALEQDLHAVHNVLLQYAGGLQALFKFYDSQKEEDPKQLDRMTLDQFRALLADARITTDNFKATAIDECFQEFQADAQSRVELTITRKLPASTSTAAPTLSFQDFLLCLVWVANKKFQLGLEGPTSGYAELSQQLSHLITDYLFPNLGPALYERVKALDAAVTDNTTLLLKKGRRLTEQTLDSCQLRRVAAAERAIDIKYLCVHLKKWEILQKRGVDLNGLMIIVLYAKHRDPELIKMELKKQPMEVTAATRCHLRCHLPSMRW
jgi:hypothetical protein